jgi:hypothetical protein
MPYPPDFPEESRLQVEYVRSEATKNMATQPMPPDWNGSVFDWDYSVFRTYIQLIVVAFAYVACELGKQEAHRKIWTADRIRMEVPRFLRQFAFKAYEEIGRDPSGRQFPGWDETVTLEHEAQMSRLEALEWDLKTSEEWREAWQQYEKELEDVREYQARRPKKFAPPPPIELNTGSSLPPPLPLGAPELRLYATLHFPDQLKSAIEEAQIAAARQFRSEVQEARAAGPVSDQKLAALKQQWFWAVFLGFATGARDLVLAGTLKAAYFGECWQDFFGEVATAADIKWAHPQVNAELKNSEEWAKFEELRLEASRARATRTTVPPRAEEAERTEESDPPPKEDENRRALVEDFILRCRQNTPLQVNRTHIWLAVGHKAPKQFERWQASDPKATKQDDENFRRILAMQPADFVELLKNRRII